MTERKEFREKRRQFRFKRAITATCIVDGQHHPARTYDINRTGMTLLAGPRVPPRGDYLVRCRLDSGTTATFKVREIQRRALSRGPIRVLRLGLSIESRDEDTVRFFNELAELEMRGMPLAISRHRGGGDRDQERVAFQLPVLTRIDGVDWRCKTLDLGNWGLAVHAPANFPVQETYQLVCVDPTGGNIPITAEVRHRHPHQDGFRIGFAVIGGVEGFQRFIHRYDMSQKQAGQ